MHTHTHTHVHTHTCTHTHMCRVWQVVHDDGLAGGWGVKGNYTQTMWHTVWQDLHSNHKYDENDDAVVSFFLFLYRNSKRRRSCRVRWRYLIWRYTVRKSKIFSAPRGEWLRATNTRHTLNQCDCLLPLVTYTHTHTHTQREADFESERTQNPWSIRREPVQASSKIL